MLVLMSKANTAGHKYDYRSWEPNKRLYTALLVRQLCSGRSGSWDGSMEAMREDCYRADYRINDDDSLRAPQEPRV